MEFENVNKAFVYITDSNTPVKSSRCKLKKPKCQPNKRDANI